MDRESPRGLQTATSRNFSRPFPSPLTASSLDNSDKLSKTRDLLNHLPCSASLFNLSRQPGKNEYLATNRSMDFTQTAASTTSTVAASGCQRQLKMIPLKKVARPDGSAGIVHSRSQYEQEVEAVSNFYASSLQDGKHHQAEKIITDSSSRVWRAVPRDIRVLSLDLFREVRISKIPPPLDAPKANRMQLSDDENDEDDNHTSIISSSDLRPLLQFQQLAHLSLTGMVESYQPLIWRVVWLQPFLRSLHLSMALAPVFNVETDQPHQLIDGAWTLNNGYRNDLTISEYLGHHGEGILHEEFGEGEYLDSQAIKMARHQVVRSLPFNNERFLPVEKLSLERFVVDGGPIMRWFDPQRLREIEFKDECIDAGLYLRPDMCHVKITAPTARPQHYHDYPCRQNVGRAVKTGELKMVDLKKGRVVSRKDTHTRREELESAQKQPGLKAKMSQLMHGWTNKRKGD